jgi:pyruvate-ferredoxin/flavodoxin oxidoreductase
MQRIEIWGLDDLTEFVDKEDIKRFRDRALNPNHPRLMGSAQNPDVYFQAREASNPFYDAMPDFVASCMDRINAKIGTDYQLFNYYGAPDAEHVLVAMGSVCDTISETVDYLNANGGKVGVIKVHLYRPFSAKHLLSAIPDSVKTITVLDRTKEPGASGEPLYLDVANVLRDSKFKDVPLLSGRYGLSSKNTAPSHINAIYENAKTGGKKYFTVGIEDDVTHLSLDVKEEIVTAPDTIIQCKFWGLGGDGTVSANKASVKIIGDHTDMYAQAYFDYDSKKSMGLTTSHLRFGTSPIHSTYLIHKANFVACHNPSYLQKYNMVQDLKDGGTFLLNFPDHEDVETHIPAAAKRYIANHNIKLYVIDAFRIGKEVGLNNKVSTILQSAFFRLADIIPAADAITFMKEAAKYNYQKKGDKIVQMNYAAIDRGANDVRQIDIPDSWKTAEGGQEEAALLQDALDTMTFVKNIQIPINAQQGNDLPVSAFKDYTDGSTPSGTSAHERRNVATEVPAWKPENCIQCNQCAYVCPHAVIRPAVLSKEEKEKAPSGMVTLPMIGCPDYEFSIVVSEVDCTNCGSCAAICPGRTGGKNGDPTKKALVMESVLDRDSTQEAFDFAKNLPAKTAVADKFKATTVKGSQFKQPLLEFSGACAGCGETPYAKLVTQLFGNRMYIANATGCSSIWGNSSPSTPYAKNKQGQGPAWSNSLFEDAAEFGYGMLLSQNAIRERLADQVNAYLATLDSPDLAHNPQGTQVPQNVQDLNAAAKDWLATFRKGPENDLATTRMVAALEECKAEGIKEAASLFSLLDEKDFLSKKSFWVFGGDGWAFDIGFGGVDHVLASGENINLLVFDTEVYSNTGGQSSKATPIGASAKFAAAGKKTPQKNLADIAMTYGNIYVAQVSMGADYNQTLKALTEAEAYDGPSLVICYAPCISHGIRTGMGTSQAEEKKAVESGYFHMFRFNPEKKENGENPFTMDSKKPTLSYQDFLAGEVRYNSLLKSNPEHAQALFDAAEAHAKERYEYLCRLTQLYAPVVEA